MKNRCNTALAEQAALVFFTRHLDSLKWNYHFSKEKRFLYSGFNGENLLWDFSMVARQQENGVFLLGLISGIDLSGRNFANTIAKKSSKIISWLNQKPSAINHSSGRLDWRGCSFLLQPPF